MPAAANRATTRVWNDLGVAEKPVRPAPKYIAEEIFGGPSVVGCLFSAAKWVVSCCYGVDEAGYKAAPTAECVAQALTQSPPASPSHRSLELTRSVSMTLLSSSPLVMSDCTARPNAQGAEAVCVQALGLASERNSLEHIKQTTGCPVELSFFCLTLRTLGEALSLRVPDILHLSGHGVLLRSGEFALLLEGDFTGAADILPLPKLEKLLEVGIGRNQRNEERGPRLVFISSCHSEMAAAAFVRNGCKHVIACIESAKVSDSASLYFTSFFCAWDHRQRSD